MGQQYLLSCDVENPEERVLRRNLNLQQLVYQAILKVFFRALIFWRIRFLKKLKMRTMWGKERYGTIFFMSVSQIHSEFRQMLSNCIQYFWSHRSRREGLDNAGWSGRSYIVLLVVLVLNVDDGQVYGLSMLATNVFKTGCSKLWSCLHEIISFSSTGWYRRHFSFSLHRWNRSVTVLFFFLFLFLASPAKVNMCWEKKRRVFLCWVGRLTTACRVDYLHKGILDNDGWNSHHDQAHIFSGEENRHLFFHTRFSVFSFKCRLLHFSLQIV